MRLANNANSACDVALNRTGDHASTACAFFKTIKMSSNKLANLMPSTSGSYALSGVGSPFCEP